MITQYLIYATVCMKKSALDTTFVGIGSFAAAAVTLLWNVWTAARARPIVIREIAQLQAEEAE